MFDLFDLMPPNEVTHFESHDPFLDWFVGHVGGRFTIEVGAGQCEFSKALYQRGVKVMAVEPRPSPEVAAACSAFLLPLQVEKVAAVRKPGIVVVVARPDHSGWFAELAGMVSPESELIYIGLDENFDLDIPEHLLRNTAMYCGAGADGETVLRVRRSDA